MRCLFAATQYSIPCGPLNIFGALLLSVHFPSSNSRTSCFAVSGVFLNRPRKPGKSLFLSNYKRGLSSKNRKSRRRVLFIELKLGPVEQSRRVTLWPCPASLPNAHAIQFSTFLQSPPSSFDTSEPRNKEIGSPQKPQARNPTWQPVLFSPFSSVHGLHITCQLCITNYHGFSPRLNSELHIYPSLGINS